MKFESKFKQAHGDVRGPPDGLNTETAHALIH